MDRRLVNLLGALSTAAADRVQGALADRLGLGGTMPAALLTISTWPMRAIDELQGILGISQPSAVRVVDRLEAAGLVRRVPGSNARVRALEVTEAGAERARELLALRRAALAELLAPLDAGERETLEALLVKMLDVVATDPGHARHLCRLCEHSACRGEACPVGSAVSRQPA